MRVSREVATKNRENVVKTASKVFREHGYDGVGIAGLMKAAGMTHGGFYKQFEDKEALIVEATRQALSENLKVWDTVAKGNREAPLETLAKWYLSPNHIGMLGDGCAFAALAAEAPRHGEALQQEFGTALDRLIGLIASVETQGGQPRKEAIKLISSLVGALILSRAVSSHELSREILDSLKANANQAN